MTKAKLNKTKRLAEEFLKASIDLEKSEPGTDCWWGSKYTAAVKRKSMDLTRALADLRRPT